MSDFHEIASQKLQNLLHAWSMFPTGLGQEKGNHELSRPSPDYSHELSRSSPVYPHELSRSSPDYPHGLSMCSPAEYPHTFKLREQRHFGLFPIVFDVFTFFCLRLYGISVSGLISCSPFNSTFYTVHLILLPNVSIRSKASLRESPVRSIDNRERRLLRFVKLR